MRVFDALARLPRMGRTKLISIDLTISRYAGSQIKFQLIDLAPDRSTVTFFCVAILYAFDAEARSHLSPAGNSDPVAQRLSLNYTYIQN